MIAIVGASAALGGLVLLFIGMVLTTVKAPTGDRAPHQYVHNRMFDRLARVGVGVFFLSVANMALGVAWLAVPGGEGLYVSGLVLFGIQLVSIAWLGWLSVGLLTK